MTPRIEEAEHLMGPATVSARKTDLIAMLRETGLGYEITLEPLFDWIERVEARR